MVTNKRTRVAFVWFILWPMLLLFSAYLPLPSELAVGITMLLAAINVFIVDFYLNGDTTRPVVSFLGVIGSTALVYCLIMLILKVSCQIGIAMDDSVCHNSRYRAGGVVILFASALFSSILMSGAFYYDRRQRAR